MDIYIVYIYINSRVNEADLFANELKIIVFILSLHFDLFRVSDTFAFLLCKIKMKFTQICF